MAVKNLYEHEKVLLTLDRHIPDERECEPFEYIDTLREIIRYEMDTYGVTLRGYSRFLEFVPSTLYRFLDKSIGVKFKTPFFVREKLKYSYSRFFSKSRFNKLKNNLFYIAREKYPKYPTHRTFTRASGVSRKVTHSMTHPNSPYNKSIRNTETVFLLVQYMDMSIDEIIEWSPK